MTKNQPKVKDINRKEKDMNNRAQKRIGVEVDTFCLISLFMKDFFRRENLTKNPSLKRLLEGLDRVQLSDWGVWADYTRRSILSEAIPSICSTLERPLTESELLFLNECAEEFIECNEMRKLQTL